MKFTEFSKYALGAMANQLEKIEKFEEGIRPKIKEACASNIFYRFFRISASFYEKGSKT